MTRFSSSFVRATLAAAVLVVSGCDGSDSSADADATYQGRVTNDAATARLASADVEGATVTAASVSASGQSRMLSGSTTTSACT